jgi:uncharacterized protein YndB with AHSA1/START domain
MTLPRSGRGPEIAAARSAGEPAGGGTGAESVTRSVELEAAPTEVWDALAEEALLREWLADEVEVDLEPGGEIVCRYADGEERRGEVELVEEAERLAWSWWREGGAGPSRVELVLDAVAAGTRLTVIETAQVLETGDFRTAGPLLAAAPLAATWTLPLARLRVAVRLVRA